MVVYTSIFNTWKLLTCKWKFQKPNNPVKIYVIDIKFVLIKL